MTWLWTGPVINIGLFVACLLRCEWNRWTVAGLIAGYLFGDVLSGLLHFAMDNYTFVREPWKSLAQAFQQHHDDQQDIVTWPYGKLAWELLLQFQIPLTVVAITLCLPDTFAYAFLIVCGFSGPWGNEGHRWSHMAVNERPRIALLTQDCA